ncbi:MAG: GCN5-related N-acetyltransferase [Frankiales bacterium]|nr:GCN5-related N-acetyltransferase [Frankiales bacterium]
MLTRPATRHDLRAVVDLYCAYDIAFRGGVDTDDSDLTGDWDKPGFDWQDGTLAVEEAGRTIGYATVVDEYADMVTDLERTDLYDLLLTWVEGHPGQLEHYVPDPDTERAAAVERHGWSPARRFWRMRLELDDPTPEPVWPDGVLARDYDRPRDDVAVHALITTSFREIGGQHERTLDEWRGYLLDTERYDASLYLVVESGGEVVGACLSQQMGSDYGFVRQLAVAPSQRGRGVGLALLHESFRRHAARGLPATSLGVDAGNPTGALGLYEKAGMRIHEQFTRWDRPAQDCARQLPGD